MRGREALDSAVQPCVQHDSELLQIVLFSRAFLLSGIAVLSVFGSIFGLAAPVLQKQFVDHLSGLGSVLNLGPHFGELIGPSSLWLWLTLAILTMLLSQWFNTASLALGVAEAIRRQRDLSELIYRKILSLRSDQQGQSTVGESVSFYATDVPGSTAFIDQTVPLGLGVVVPFVAAPWMIHAAVGLPVWHTYFALSVLIAISMGLSIRQAHFFQKFKELAATRIGFVNEWVQNMRLLRILGWVEAFEAKIFASRERETINRIRMVTNGQMMGAFGSSVNFVLSIVGISLLLAQKGERATPGDFFAILWIYGVFLSRPFRQVPWLFTFSFDAWTSIQRLNKFLTRSPESLNQFSAAASPLSHQQDASLSVRKLNLSLGGVQVLQDVSFQVRSGEFVAIVGPVGSGKSLLLLSLLGETGATAEDLRVGSLDLLSLPISARRSLFSYVPQEGFVMSATVRENVAFEYHANPSSDPGIRRSLELAQFNLLHEGIPEGLESSIGERGVNLSGGQKQRMTLARTAFLERPIVLIDDALSAVDVGTEAQLVEQLFHGEWAGRTRLLVTHRFSVLPMVDRILFMQEGRVTAFGSYEELMRTQPAFKAHVLGAS